MGLIHHIGHAIHTDQKHIRIVPALVQACKLIHDHSFIVLGSDTGSVIFLPGAMTGISVRTYPKGNVI